MITSTSHYKGITVTASADGVPTAIHIEPAELRFGAEALALRVLELTSAAARSALSELR
ncbi:MAG: hypothetical protein LLG14_10800 [Nocardiaceae bacterium]|nr:hypothetical protein [Nocardiaceae bacterium]